MLSQRAALHVVMTGTADNHRQVKSLRLRCQGEVTGRVNPGGDPALTKYHQVKSSSPRSAADVDPVYAVLASADLAVVLAVSLGAVLVAIAVIVAMGKAEDKAEG